MASNLIALCQITMTWKISYLIQINRLRHRTRQRPSALWSRFADTFRIEPQSHYSPVTKPRGIYDKTLVSKLRQKLTAKKKEGMFMNIFRHLPSLKSHHEISCSLRAKSTSAGLPEIVILLFKFQQHASRGKFSRRLQI